MQSPKGRAPRDVLILGAGNLGNVLFDCLEGDDRWRVVGFLDEGKAGLTAMLGLPVVQPAASEALGCGNVFMAIGASAERAALASRLADLGLTWMTYVDRRSHVSRRAILGEGSIVLPFASIGPGTSVGRFAYIGAYASVGTKAVVGDFSSLLPRASAGSCRIGARCTIGFNSACLDGAVLEDDVFVAPYTWVRKSIPSLSFVSGMPPRISRGPLVAK